MVIPKAKNTKVALIQKWDKELGLSSE